MNLRLKFLKEVVMLEQYFIKPATIDRIRASWLAPQIERRSRHCS